MAGQQLMEKIDKIREVAGRCLQHLFKWDLPAFAMKAQLTTIFTQEADEQVELEGIAYLPWRKADFVFTQFMPLFDSPYSLQILKGLITSTGTKLRSSSARRGDLRLVSPVAAAQAAIESAAARDRESEPGAAARAD